MKNHDRYETGYRLDMFRPMVDGLMRLEAEKARLLGDPDREVSMIGYILLESRLDDINRAQERGLDFLYRLLADNFAGC